MMHVLVVNCSAQAQEPCLAACAAPVHVESTSHSIDADWSMQVWFGKMGDLVDLKADASALAASEALLRKEIANAAADVQAQAQDAAESARVDVQATQAVLQDRLRDVEAGLQDHSEVKSYPLRFCLTLQSMRLYACLRNRLLSFRLCLHTTSR